jgi:hypothetical protein
LQSRAATIDQESRLLNSPRIGWELMAIVDPTITPQSNLLRRNLAAELLR